MSTPYKPPSLQHIEEMVLLTTTALIVKKESTPLSLADVSGALSQDSAARPTLQAGKTPYQTVVNRTFGSQTVMLSMMSSVLVPVCSFPQIGSTASLPIALTLSATQSMIAALKGVDRSQKGLLGSLDDLSDRRKIKNKSKKSSSRQDS